jgi:hypothetical protein
MNEKDEPTWPVWQRRIADAIGPNIGDANSRMHFGESVLRGLATALPRGRNKTGQGARSREIGGRNFRTARCHGALSFGTSAAHREDAAFTGGVQSGARIDQFRAT